jgi:hypothetical protein
MRADLIKKTSMVEDLQQNTIFSQQYIQQKDFEQKQKMDLVLSTIEKM